MFVTVVSTVTNNNKQRTTRFQKRTQTNPILPALAGKIALSEVEGPVSRDLSKTTTPPAVLLRLEAFDFTAGIFSTGLFQIHIADICQRA